MFALCITGHLTIEENLSRSSFKLFDLLSFILVRNLRYNFELNRGDLVHFRLLTSGRLSFVYVPYHVVGCSSQTRDQAESRWIPRSTGFLLISRFKHSSMCVGTVSMNAC